MIDIGIFYFWLLILDQGFQLFPSSFFNFIFIFSSPPPSWLDCSLPLVRTVNFGISILLVWYGNFPCVGISPKEIFFRQAIGHTSSKNLGNVVNLGGKGRMVFARDVSPSCAGTALCLKILEISEQLCYMCAHASLRAILFGFDMILAWGTFHFRYIFIYIYIREPGSCCTGNKFSYVFHQVGR